MTREILEGLRIFHHLYDYCFLYCVYSAASLISHQLSRSVYITEVYDNVRQKVRHSQGQRSRSSHLSQLMHKYKVSLSRTLTFIRHAFRNFYLAVHFDKRHANEKQDVCKSWITSWEILLNNWMSLSRAKILPLHVSTCCIKFNISNLLAFRQKRPYIHIM